MTNQFTKQEKVTCYKYFFFYVSFNTYLQIHIHFNQKESSFRRLENLDITNYKKMTARWRPTNLSKYAETYKIKIHMNFTLVFEINALSINSDFVSFKKYANLEERDCEYFFFFQYKKIITWKISQNIKNIKDFILIKKLSHIHLYI